MTLPAGSRIGPYEVVGLLGAGGMGEVYRARDARLSRDVALKVLSADRATDRDRLARFEREARAASALHHPAIVAVYDIGEANGHWFMAMELIDGATLRAQISERPLPLRRLLDLAIPIAHGLARAHRSGIVHRDLKPENVMTSADGVVKIVDFGIAKLQPDVRGDDEPTASVPHATAPGTLIGTVSYMSPEQASGRPVDFRSDQFSFGTMLTEMATGRHPFLRDTTPQTLTAIIEHDPPPVRTLNAQLPLPLAWIIERCLAKDAADRYGSTDDLARDLVRVRDHLSDPGLTSVATPSVLRASQKRLMIWLGAATLTIASFAGGWLVSERGRDSAEPPTWRRLTFHSGRVVTARFTSDGQSVIFGAAFGGNPLQIYLATIARPEARALDLPSGTVLAASKTGELLLSLGCRWEPAPALCRGTLAQVPLLGGAPRRLAEDVSSADWGANGQIAVARAGVVEFPIGTVRSKPAGAHVRVAPNGRDVAWFRGGSVVVADSRGERQVSSGWRFLDSLAWTPDGSALLISGQRLSTNCNQCVVRVDLDGTERTVLRSAGRVRVLDVNPDGALLVIRSEGTAIVTVRSVATGDPPMELSWFDSTTPDALARDGRTLLFTERGSAATGREEELYPIFVRPTDGRPAVRLGSGYGRDFSPDGKWALTITRGSPRLVLYPLPSGAPRTLETQPFDIRNDDNGLTNSAPFFAGSERVVFPGRPKGESTAPWRTIVQDIAGGSPTVVDHEPGVIASAVAPDGNRFISRRLDGSLWVASIAATEAAPLKGGLAPNQRVIAWDTDGRGLYISTVSDSHLAVDHRELATGRDRRVADLEPGSLTGFISWAPAHISADGRTLVVKESRELSNLYVVEGVNVRKY